MRVGGSGWRVEGHDAVQLPHPHHLRLALGENMRERERKGERDSESERERESARERERVQSASRRASLGRSNVRAYIFL